MASILDLLNEEERAQVSRRFNKRMLRRRKERNDRITPEIYLLAEFGYYLGYDAIRDVRENRISIEEMYAILEGCRKVWYSKLVETTQGTSIAVGTAFSKNAKQDFVKAMKPYSERAKVEG